MKTINIVYIALSLFARSAVVNANEENTADSDLIKACTSARGIDNVDDVKAALAMVRVYD
jgi:hypothetical protein